ncbi:VOC family protein [Antrihabitans stalactiti]|uniref:Glyoxalase n=1 Tax=Antrihabitans stalactiti TaxID=2584121 RepID=A0A848KED5_9NOCA|nr:VOC family protein [Antrihabitans stalactiti]NMN97185.1 glyoxalase [Antrihabitans stalactiti]
MPTNIFVSYPTSDLKRATAFYTALGATINPVLTDDNATCFVWDDNISTMVLKREFFASMTEKQIGDQKTAATFQIAFTRDSREEVDKTIEAGLAVGGREPGPAQDYGFMYTRDIEDLDGNTLAFIYSAPQAVEQAPETAQAQA